MFKKLLGVFATKQATKIATDAFSSDELKEGLGQYVEDTKKFKKDLHRLGYTSVDALKAATRKSVRIPTYIQRCLSPDRAEKYSYWNEKPEREEIWKDNKLWTALVWKPNGERCPETNLKDGNGVVLWYDDEGREEGRWTYEDGGLVTQTLIHRRNGQKYEEATYKNVTPKGLGHDGETLRLWSVIRWKPNGERRPGTYVVDGNGVCPLGFVYKDGVRQHGRSPDSPSTAS